MALPINKRFLLGKSKEWVGYSMNWMTTLVENDNWEEVVGRCHAHGRTKFSIGSCIPRKYMNQWKLSGSSFHYKSFPYWPNNFSLTIHSGFHGLGPWVTKIIPGFCWIFNGFLHITWFFPCVSQGPLFKASKGYIKVLGPWCSSCYISSDRDPCCMSSGLTKILFFFLYYYYYYYFFFPSFWDFEPSWSFLT